MKKISILFFFITAASVISCSKVKNEISAPLITNKFEKLTSNKELTEFVIQADKNSEHIHTTLLDSFPGGLYFPLVKIVKGEISAQDKINVLFIGQQHGNEQSGKEGLLLLIQDFANGMHMDLLDKINIYIIPQANPYGSDNDQRRTREAIDMNRDHLILRAKESILIQKVYKDYLPELVVDIHEYYTYSKGWQRFGYIRNFDIQLGGPTNINIDTTIHSFFHEKLLPFVKSEVNNAGYSFFEYTLGFLPDNERLRHSTTDINDGRQSTGITNALSLIIEGKNGRDSIDHIERRAKSQYSTVLAILKVADSYQIEIKQMVKTAQNQLLRGIEKDVVSIRSEHFSNGEILEYPLLSLNTDSDTIFMIENYHPEVRSTLDVLAPKGYLIPKDNQKLSDWLTRSFFEYFDYEQDKNDSVYQYEIMKLTETVEEELKNLKAEVKKVFLPKIESERFYFIPVNQIYAYKIITALEPQATFGLINYPEFDFLAKLGKFPILRVE